MRGPDLEENQIIRNSGSHCADSAQNLGLQATISDQVSRIQQVCKQADMLTLTAYTSTSTTASLYVLTEQLAVQPVSAALQLWVTALTRQRQA
jgi:hypothetical protein